MVEVAVVETEAKGTSVEAETPPPNREVSLVTH
jgi:hypothetical protein